MEVIGIVVTMLGTFITVLAIILAWKSDRRMQKNIGERLAKMLENITNGQKEIAQMINTGQKEIAQMLLNQTRILERMEARMGQA